MTVAITCKECGQDVTFLFDGETRNPTQKCDCGAMYKLSVKRCL